MAGERDGHSRPPRENDQARPDTGMEAKPNTDIADAGARMAADMPAETEQALDRSLAVQGEREDGVIGADEEE